MKIYVASRFHNKEQVIEIYKKLTDIGHEIIVDWTVHKNIKPYNKNPDIAKEYAIEDINGVKDCDVFILLTSEEVGSGTSTELGIAIATQLHTGKPKIYVVGEHIHTNFCFFHPVVNRKETIEEVLIELK